MTGKNYRLTRDQIRRFHLQRQLLVGPALPSGKAGVLAAIERLGYVQIDTISVIERSHHLVLYARHPAYQPRYLDELLGRDQKIFEYWAHAASFIPMSDYRFYRNIIRCRPDENSWSARWSKKNRAVLNRVRRRIEKEGPLTAADFPDDPNRKRGSWWDWKPEKAALEVLFWTGVLMIKERRKFQRVYDLTERVLPAGVNLTPPLPGEEQSFFIRRALGALGAATIQDINRYIGVAGRLNDRLAVMVKDGQVTAVEVGDSVRPHFVLTEDWGGLTNPLMPGDPRVKFLSPFDNSIILRDRTEMLFDFHVALECYLPPQKRKYGYFCLPILWRNDLVGRIDLKADRPRRAFLVQRLYLEKKLPEPAEFFPALALTLKEFAAYHDCPEIRFKRPVPTRLAKKISGHW